jgi:hypothetical protein
MPHHGSCLALLLESVLWATMVATPHALPYSVVCLPLSAGTTLSRKNL